MPRAILIHGYAGAKETAEALQHTAEVCTACTVLGSVLALALPRGLRKMRTAGAVWELV